MGLWKGVGIMGEGVGTRGEGVGRKGEHLPPAPDKHGPGHRCRILPALTPLSIKVPPNAPPSNSACLPPHASTVQGSRCEASKTGCPCDVWRQKRQER